MRIYLVHDHFEEKHLDDVVEEMKVMGQPEIKVTSLEMYTENFYQAIEGCHRLRACQILGIEPKIIVIDDNVKIEDAEIDFDGCAELVSDISNLDGEYIEF